jgi:hypothetical protein
MEFVKGWKNNEGWNPAGENGKTSGANDDAAIFLIHQSKVSKKVPCPLVLDGVAISCGMKVSISILTEYLRVDLKWEKLT